MPQHKDPITKKWYYEFSYKTATNEARRRKQRGFETKREAKDAEDTERLKLKKSPPSSMKFKQLYKLYVEAKENEWLHNTKRKFTTGIDLHVLPCLGDMLLEKITTKDIEGWKTAMYNKLTPEGERYKVQSLNCIKGYLNALFNYAINHRYITFNPAKSVRGFKNVKEDERQEKQVWSKEEFKKFIKCVDDNMWHVFFLFLWCTGVRIGEAQGVMFKDINFEDKTVTISKSIDTKQKGVPFAIHPTKTKRTRIVDIPDTLILALEPYYESQKKSEGWGEDRFLFGIEKPFPNTTIDKARRKYIEIAGVKYISSHCFRHSHATYLLSEGIDIKSVSDRLGHKDVSETLNTYAHVLHSSKSKILRLLNESI